MFAQLATATMRSVEGRYAQAPPRTTTATTIRARTVKGEGNGPAGRTNWQQQNQQQSQQQNQQQSQQQNQQQSQQQNQQQSQQQNQQQNQQQSQQQNQQQSQQQNQQQAALRALQREKAELGARAAVSTLADAQLKQRLASDLSRQQAAWEEMKRRRMRTIDMLCAETEQHAEYASA
jgi:hypothetical protein